MNDSELSGIKVSNINNVVNPNSNTLFYTIQNNNNQLSSTQIKYFNLSGQILNDIIKGLRLNSMAHEDRFIYSLSSHNHDKLYSKVNIKDLYTNDETKIFHLADIKITNNSEISTYHIDTPKILTYNYEKPKIGTLRFVSINNNIWTLRQYDDGNYNIDTESEDYEGWVFPNGGYLDTISVQLPNLNKFLCIKPQKTTRVQYKNSLFTHSHDDVNADFQLKGQLEMYKCWVPTSRGCNSTGKYGHNGGVDAYTTANITIDFSKAHMFGIETEDVDEQYKIETKPYHNLMPVMIYVGI